MRQSDMTGRIKEFGSHNNLIICSNRAPFVFSEKNGSISKKRSGGGLVSAFMSIKDIEFTWYALAQNETEKNIGLKGVKADNITIKFVSVTDAQYNDYYNKICNKVLWYTQHDLWDNVYDPAFDLDFYGAWKNYRLVNKKFAEALKEEDGNDKPSYIMIQDYHLYLLPQYLRQMGNESMVDLFVHIPWPGLSSWDIVPDFAVKEILKSILNCDVTSFHCQQYAQNFGASINRYLGLSSENETFVFKGRKTKIKYFPISIDASELTKVKNEPLFKKSVSDIKESTKGKLIVRVDRADLSKNIFRGFLAYKALLEKRKDLIGKVTFLAMLYPTRTKISDYREYVQKIRSLTDRINAKFATKSWQPIIIRFKDNYLQSIAALSIYDILLVNPIADGMNLVAKEGPVVNEKDGVLILSRLCGAHNELGGFALSINPFDVAQTAAALEKALELSKEDRVNRSNCLKTIVEHNNTRKWLYYNIMAMEAAADEKKESITA